MNVTFRCPQCDHIGRVDIDATAAAIACPNCQAKWPVPAGAVEGGNLAQCVVCPSTELFVRKDFSQSLGVAIVAFGIVVSSLFWYWRMPLWTYGVLFATALIDVILYLTVGNLLQCYRCQAQYRNVPGLENHEPFNLETHERHRQQRIRLEQSARAAK